VEATGRPFYNINITQGARCRLFNNISSGAQRIQVSCVQAPQGPFSFWIDFQNGNAEHFTCTGPCPNGSAVTWPLNMSARNSHVGNQGALGLGTSLILIDEVAPPRAMQDADCFFKWFGTNGGTNAYPGDPQALGLWTFSSGSNMGLMLMPSAAGSFISSCDNSGKYKIGSSFAMAPPTNLASIYQNGNANGQKGIEQYIGCRPTPGSLCEAYSATVSPIYYIAPGNPRIEMMSGAVGDDQTVPPLYNEVPYQQAFAAIGVAIPWIPLSGTPDYHAMDCQSKPLWNTQCLQQAITFFRAN
jgi:hypothetical protein